MQNYIDLAEKNGITLIGKGKCQFCGAPTKRGIHECMTVFSLGFQDVDFSKKKNHLFRFLIVDAHALQHPEIHGRWSNHFHLLRLHIIFEFGIQWTYQLSPKLSDYLNAYKAHKPYEYLIPPKALQRGKITSFEVMEKSINEKEAKAMIRNWALAVYQKWSDHHTVVDVIAKGFLNRK